jgi:lipopolysaccharide/colanic/teichoic acid biosynthesis glycosyltransferase
MYPKIFKRIIDFSIALISLLFFSPLIILIFIILFFVNKGSPFFKQPRTGKNERSFIIVKFKTMTNEKDENGVLLNEKLRLTRFGKFLRKTSLDELPQLYNVLMGDMSFVGPRPLLIEYLPYYTDEERRRLIVRPGITGLAQINGRNYILWEDRVKYDLEYVDSVSFKTDLSILTKTVMAVIQHKNITVDEGEKGRARLNVRRDPKNAGKYDNNGFLIEK